MLLAELPGGGVLGACRSASEVVSKPWASGQRYSMKDDVWAPLQVSTLLPEVTRAAKSGEPLRHKPSKTNVNSQTEPRRIAPRLCFTIPSSRFASGPPLRLATGMRSHLHTGAAQRTIATLAVAPCFMQSEKRSCPTKRECARGTPPPTDATQAPPTRCRGGFRPHRADIAKSRRELTKRPR